MNRGVGDVDALVDKNGVGVLIERFSLQAYESAFNQLKALTFDREPFARKCREVAEQKFDLVEIGGTRYRHIYDRLFADR